MGNLFVIKLDFQGISICHPYFHWLRFCYVTIFADAIITLITPS